MISDSNPEVVYNRAYPDGIVVSYTTSSTGCSGSGSGCSGHGECLNSGLCRCDPGYGGGDCSHEHCLGVQEHAAGVSSGTMSSGTLALTKGNLYPNSALCHFAVRPETAFVRFELDYDVEVRSLRSCLPHAATTVIAASAATTTTAAATAAAATTTAYHGVHSRHRPP